MDVAATGAPLEAGRSTRTGGTRNRFRVQVLRDEEMAVAPTNMLRFPGSFSHVRIPDKEKKPSPLGIGRNQKFMALILRWGTL